MKNLQKPLFLAAMMVCAVACGDDDDGKQDGTPLRDAAVADGGGVGPSGPGAEGWLCQKQSDCDDALKCVASVFTVGVCARACSETDPCDASDEVCYSYSGKDADLHCVNQVTEEYALCGVADTSICKERSCLYAPDAPIGVCVDICSTEGEVTPTDAGIDDGGLIVGAPAGFAMCRAGESCIDGVLADPGNDEGVCGVEVARGKSCSVADGKYCKVGDVCAPDDPSSDDALWTCHQDCSSGNACDEGRCTVIQNLIAYCL
jgi:hypothetical protein